MADTAPSRDSDTGGPSSPADPRVAAVLGLVSKHGLFPTVVAIAFAYLLYSLATGFSMKLEALEHKLDAHQNSVDHAELERTNIDRAQSARLKGICYGVTEEGSRARAFCDVE